ncbi:MAG TPA: type VI secretion system baseplate subunit TssK [Bryobacteraceae bacterium]|nr:type VI secretion system baseplate subunit TssK [Bryobacteraceae bacterium]
MKLLSKVVWSEGMHLGPHHFQAQGRYVEDSIQFATSSLWYRPYGLVGADLDSEALANGTISVLHARGVFPDGLPFNMPECDALPDARNITDLFPPTRDALTVMLAIPPRRPGGVNCVLDNIGDKAARYVAEARVFHDENTGVDERSVRLGRKNTRLMLDTEATDDVVTLPLARIMRDGSGHFIFDPDFIPPCIQITASERLMLMLRRLIDILEEKGASLGRRPGGSLGEFSSREVASFWLLHAVNSGLAPLRHIWMSKRGHPEELFVEMSRLGGALCTFALDSHPRAMPVYDHDRLTECFDALDRHIRAHLETIVPTNCISIPLKSVRPYFWEGEITDQRVLGRSRWVFAIHSNVGEADLIARTPQLVKVCSSLFVPELVRRALPGMAMTHLPVPPAAVSTRVETQYFGVTKAGPCWDHLVQTRKVGVYVPGDLPEPEIELLVVLDSQ